MTVLNKHFGKNHNSTSSTCSYVQKYVVRPATVILYVIYNDKFIIKGDLLYVNYGRIEDFTWLKEEKNMNFTGKICIARYGKIFRGDKVIDIS